MVPTDSKTNTSVVILDEFTNDYWRYIESPKAEDKPKKPKKPFPPIPPWDRRYRR